MRKIFIMLMLVSNAIAVESSLTDIEKKKQIIEQFLKQEKIEKQITKKVSLKEDNGQISEDIKVQINPVLLEKDLKKSLDKGKVETQMVKPPPVPIIIPPKVVRVLIYPYIDSRGNFHGPNYVFTEVKKSRWVVGDYLPTADSYFSSNRFTVLER